MNQIQTQMNKLRLHGMSQSWTALQEARKLHELSLSDGMALLLQAEEQERDNDLNGSNTRQGFAIKHQ